MASLYLHIPFCEHKCVYCDFYSLESREWQSLFVDLLCREAEFFSSSYGGEEVETIFLGGGTPSLLTPQELGQILSVLHRRFSIRSDAEVTLETNPGTVNAEKLRAFRALGVNRLSIGIQSFHDDDLRFLTRIHTSEQARACVRLANDIGFPFVNLDLIFALPGQTMERWQHNLEEAVSLGTNHISAYSLIVERNTPLFRMVETGGVSTLPIETEADMYLRTMAFLREHGFEHYEVSNYARAGCRSRHNMNYWNHSPYLGFGPSAHSFWENRRWWNIANLSTYCDALDRGSSPVAGEETLATSQLLDERIMLGLRSSGVDVAAFRRDFGDQRWAQLQFELAALEEDALLIRDQDVVRLTDRGYLLCDEIVKRCLTILSPA